MMDHSEYDVIVVGGGPAGSTVASLLAQRGEKVLVLEKERFPRFHIGESLLPGTLRVMRRLGVLEKIETAGFTRKFGATYVWGKARSPWTIRFSEVAEDASHAFQVDRATFDKILLDHSRESGATVLEGCKVTGFVEENGRITGVHYVDETQNPRIALCKICVDASGQSSLLGNHFNLREFNPTLRNIAIFGHFQGGKSVVEYLPDLTPRDAGNIFVVTTEAGWIWYIPQKNNRFSVGLVTAATHSHGINTMGRRSFYLKALQETPEIAFLLEGARMEPDRVTTISDWSYICRHFQGPGYMLAGDAACFVDPILSTGVDLAMEGALKAAYAINTASKAPELANRAMEWYEEEYRHTASSFLEMAEHWYHGERTQNSWFWKARRLVDPGSNLSMRQAFILLSAGFANQLKDRDSNKQKQFYFGGFSAPQLKTIYESLDNGVPENFQPNPARETAPASDDNKIADNSCVRFGEGVRFRPYMSYMSSRDDKLLPIIQILRDAGKLSPLRIVVSSAAQPILERIDGKRSVGEIVGEVASVFGKDQDIIKQLRISTFTLLQGLADARMIEQ